jgi:hypothetical protein
MEPETKPANSARNPKGAGRKAGSPNKKTKELQDKIAASGLTPLDYMLGVMRNPKVKADRRDKMAIAAAPYVHPKLASVVLSGKEGRPIEFTQITRRIVKPQ